MKTFLGRCVVGGVTGLACGAPLAAALCAVALYGVPEVAADAVPFLTAEDRGNTVPASWDEPFSGEFTPTTTATAGPSIVAAADRCAYFEIHTPSTNSGVMTYGGADDATVYHQMPAGTTKIVYVAQLAELKFDGFDADDKITYLGYR